jgi:hypothetical protein
VYFIDSSQMAPVLLRLHPEGFELAPGLHFLGSSGIVELFGVSLAFFGVGAGWEDSQLSEPSTEAVSDFLSKCRGKHVDILLTNDWSR